jgi:hypothetical protein
VTAAVLTALSIAIGLSTLSLEVMPKPPRASTAAGTGPAVRGAAVVDVAVRPRVSFAPATALIVAQVERQAENRGLRVEATSSAYSSSSYRTLDGEFEARTHTFKLENLPAGLYTITATVYGTGGHLRAVDSSVIDVKP